MDTVIATVPSKEGDGLLVIDIAKLPSTLAVRVIYTRHVSYSHPNLRGPIFGDLSCPICSSFSVRGIELSHLKR